jgi:hypothetical protein
MIKAQVMMGPPKEAIVIKAYRNIKVVDVGASRNYLS